MGTKLYVKMNPADALKALGKQLDGVTVQVVRPVKVKDKETGAEKDGVEAKEEPLAVRHVLSAKKWKNGQVTITTIDGRRYPAKADTAVEADEELEGAAA